MEDTVDTGSTVEQEVATTAPEETVDEKVFRQEEVDKIVAERIARERKKYESKYADVDLDRYNDLVQREERAELEAKKKRGEFEKILEETASKKDSVINELKGQIHSIKVEGALLNAASKGRAVNPDQVTKLLRENVRLTETGDVEVVDESGTARYRDDGKLVSVEDYVTEWLAANPHFVASTPGGSGSQSVTRNNPTSGTVDIASLDMNRRDHREIYKRYKAERKNA